MMQGEGKMKKRVTVVILCWMTTIGIVGCAQERVRFPAVQEYVPGNGNIKGNVDAQELLEEDRSFEIGANSGGYAVFKHPKEAFLVMTEKYSDGIRLIRQEFGLKPLTQNNYESYKTYGWQVTEGSDEAKKEASEVSAFLDIYENSFKK